MVQLKGARRHPDDDTARDLTKISLIIMTLIIITLPGSPSRISTVFLRECSAFHMTLMFSFLFQGALMVDCLMPSWDSKPSSLEKKGRRGCDGVT